MKRMNRLLGAALAFALAACASSDPSALVSQGYDELNAGHADAALEKFNQALSGLTREDAKYVDARMGVVEALIVVDSKRAVEAFLGLSKEFPDQVGEKQLIYVSSKLSGARRFDEATRLVNDSITLAGEESPALLAMLERIQQEAARPPVNPDLQGVPYVK